MPSSQLDACAHRASSAMQTATHPAYINVNDAIAVRSQSWTLSQNKTLFSQIQSNPHTPNSQQCDVHSWYRASSDTGRYSAMERIARSVSSEHSCAQKCVRCVALAVACPPACLMAGAADRTAVAHSRPAGRQEQSTQMHQPCVAGRPMPRTLKHAEPPGTPKHVCSAACWTPGTWHEPWPETSQFSHMTAGLRSGCKSMPAH